MGKKFDVQERTIEKVFSEKRKYSIPRNQRDYVWNTDHFADLWDDIDQCISIDNTTGDFTKGEYFVGTCILMPNQNSIEIVDGQQRFTTIAIFLSVLASKFKEEGLLDHFEATKGLLEKTDRNNQLFVLLENDNLSPYFENEILSFKDRNRYEAKSDQERKIFSAYTFFSNKIEEKKNHYPNRQTYLSYLIALKDQIFDLVIIEVLVASGSEVDAYTIFEILNARGKELELNDKIKNWIMKRWPTIYPLDHAKKIWNDISSVLLGISGADGIYRTFIKHYWTHRFGYVSSDDELYRSFKRGINSEEIPTFLDDLLKKAEIYCLFSNPKENEIIDSECFFHLQTFRKSRIVQFKPLLLGLYASCQNGQITPKKFRAMVKSLYNFHMVFSLICGRSANIVEKTYQEFAPKFFNQYIKKDWDEFIEKLNAVLPSKEEYYNKLKEKKYSNKTKGWKADKFSIQRLIIDIENYKQNTNELRINHFSLEHIAPDNGSFVNSTIGNFLPLSEALNNDSENDVLENKVKHYQKSNLVSVKDFLSRHSNKKIWSEEDINDRTKKLSDLTYDKIYKL